MDAITRAKRIKLAAFDIDGVMTDGGLHYTDDGGELKTFNVQDGLGIVLMRRAGFELAIVTGRTSGVVESRAADLGISHVFQGVADKRVAVADLLAANLSLGDKIEALKSTESILRETRDSAVQAGKLAVLGQMAAGISHEVNQPLTALHTYTDNAVSLLEMGRLTDVRENLGFIKQMAVRMGKIVGEIKTFARKPTANVR